MAYKVAKWDRRNQRFELYLDGAFIGYCYGRWRDACALLAQAEYEKQQAASTQRPQ